MPTYQLNITDGEWTETVERLGSREACYHAAIASGEGDYIILDWRGERDRELRVSAEGTMEYRIPGALNWHQWKP